jgi:hypothetical protein
MHDSDRCMHRDCVPHTLERQQRRMRGVAARGFFVVLAGMTAMQAAPAQVPAFAAHRVLPSSVVLDMTAGDLDGDGDVDFSVLHHSSNGVSIHLALGDGNYSEWFLVVPGQTRGQAIGDLDGDGDLEHTTTSRLGRTP